MGAYKSFDALPARHRPDALRPLVEAHERRDGRSTLDAYRETESYTTASARRREQYDRALGSWVAFCDARDVHPTLATPADVEAWLAALLDGSAPGFERTGRAKSVGTVYLNYYTVLEQCYDWLVTHTDHPTIYNAFLFAAAAYPEGATGRVWSEKIARGQL